MRYFISRFRRVKFKDMFDIWKLVLSIVPALIYRLRHNDLWIICEDANEARDNGYWFFKYIRENHPEQECVYAIKKTSQDYNKVASLGEVVEYGSLKHWILYLASSKKISSQKAGNPNAAIFFPLEVYGILKNKRVFLQHGVTVSDAKWLYYNVTRIRAFTCGAYPEFVYIKERFDYPSENLFYTGLCRFDGLHNYEAKKIILIMPTWREWIADEDYRLELYEGTNDIQNTRYFKTWNAFIRDSRVKELSDMYNVKFIFFPHRNMQKYINLFPASDEFIEIADSRKYDVQELMKFAAMMVTDYSSVFFDMLYMKKPVIFYQFDYDDFRKGQYSEGYFDYKNNVFAKSFENKTDVFNEIENIIKINFQVSERFINEHMNYFELYDNNNCKRTYDIVKKL